MKKSLALVAVTVISLSMAGTARAGDWDLRFKFKPVAGIGATFDKKYFNETGNGAGGHLIGGATLLALDEDAHIGFLGAGLALNISRADGNIPNGSMNGYANWVWTFMPVRVGPLAYSVSFSKNNYANSAVYGRMHLFTFDILGFIRFYNNY